jgi:hypothetical protein
VQFNVENGIDATAQDLTKLMAEHLGIDDCEVAEEALAIWLISPLLGEAGSNRKLEYSFFPQKSNSNHIMSHTKFSKSGPPSCVDSRQPRRRTSLWTFRC